MSNYTVYDAIMLDPDLKKEVLIKFGFGQVEPKRVEEWFKKKRPETYHALRKALHTDKVVGFNPRETEATSKEYRNQVLDNFMAQLDQ